MESAGLFSVRRIPNNNNRYVLNIDLIRSLCDAAKPIGSAKVAPPNQSGCAKTALPDVPPWHPNALEERLSKELRHSDTSVANRKGLVQIGERLKGFTKEKS